MTDPAGNVVQVTEPNPGGGTVDTLYTYNSLNKLTQVSMTRAGFTQTRTFSYDDAGRVLTAANPENGTVTYAYNSDGLVATKTDAKGQQVQYTYDTYKRLTQARRYTPVTYPPYLSEDVNQRTDYYYDTNPFPQYGMTLENAWGRLTAVVSRNPSYYCQPNPSDPSSAFNTPVNTFTYQYSYTQAGLIKKKRMRVDRTGFVNLDAAYTYDNEGRTTSVTYPPVPTYPNGPGAGQFTYSFDTMGRPNQLVDVNNNNAVVVTGVAYGAADQLTQITYDGLQETRTYNSRLQLTRLTAGSVMDLEYRYSGTQNNGQITQQKDWLSGEEVTYGYDSLARLTSAVTTDAPGVTQWGFSFSYDGHGNLTGKTVTKGSPSGGGFSAAYDATTNHQVGQSYDLNGNMWPSGAYYPVYDIENRLAESTSLGACEIYGYDSSNKRVWKMLADQTEEFYLYGIDGRRLGTYWTGWTGGAPLLPRDIYQKSTNLYFAGKMVRSQDKTVVLDRLGSVRANLTTGERFSYYPYGEEVGTTAQGREKFGTYSRDATGLDYADQRYYSSTPGRFLTPDPIDAGTPQGWNKYAYVHGDPINYYDPSGNNEADPNLWVPYSVSLFPSIFGVYSWSEGVISFTATGVGYVFVLTPVPGPGGGGGPGPRRNRAQDEPCNRAYEDNAKVIDFIQSHKAAAQSLTVDTGGRVPYDYILAWAALESGYGNDPAAILNGNYFGLKVTDKYPTGGWIGAVRCGEGTWAQHACFGLGNDPFYDSGYAALFSHGERNLSRLTAELANAAHTVQTVFDAIASGAPNMQFNTNPAYGSTIQQVYNDWIRPRLDCK